MKNALYFIFILHCSLHNIMCEKSENRKSVFHAYIMPIPTPCTFRGNGEQVIIIICILGIYIYFYIEYPAVY